MEVHSTFGRDDGTLIARDQSSFLCSIQERVECGSWQTSPRLKIFETKASVKAKAANHELEDPLVLCDRRCFPVG